MEVKEIFEKLTSFSIPNSASFIDDNHLRVKFSEATPEIGRIESSTAIINLNDPDEIIYKQHTDSESLVAHSKDGKRRAIIRTIPYSKSMPIGIKKASEENLILLEVYEGQKRLVEEIMTDENGNVITNLSISSGLEFSPNGNYLAFNISEKTKQERESVLGFTSKTYEYKDFGEDLDGIYNTLLVVFSIQDKKAEVIGAPKDYAAHKFHFASDNVIVLIGFNTTQPHVLGLRSYRNRILSLFAVKTETKEFKQILGPKRCMLSVRPINESEARIFTMRIPDDFGGHSSPAYPESLKLNLETLEVNTQVSGMKEYTVYDEDAKWVSDSQIAFTAEVAGQLIPYIMDLDSFQTKEIVKLDQNESAIFCDVRGNHFAVLKSTPITRPVLYLVTKNLANAKDENGESEIKDTEVALTEEDDHLYDNCHVIRIKAPKGSNSILIVPENATKFVIMPHGGPHGMWSTYYSQHYSSFALAGIGMCLINFVGSLGESVARAKAICGKAGTADLEDLMETISILKKDYGATSVGVWGYSHGGFLGAHVAAKHSSEVDFVVIGGPCTNLIGLNHTSDIPDWAPVECGLTDDVDGVVNLSPEVMSAMWDASPLKYVDGVTVPILIFHGRTDRRVPLLQSIEFYGKLKELGRKAKLVIYEGCGHSMKRADAWYDMIASSIEFMRDPEGYIEK